ncbi:MAG: hypothetical protein ABI778_09695 [Ignavibacteriota bacterium]
MKYLSLALLLLGSAAIAGPIFPGRCIIYAPEFRKPSDTTKGAVFLRQQGIWGDLTKGFQSAGDRFYWSISTGGIIQFIEWEQSAIYLIGDYDMAADQHSSIYFHPRGIFWTEGVMFMENFGATEFHAGYINRCHHDIDNLENNLVGAGEQRTLIYSSILERFVWRNVDIAGLHSALWAQADEYVFREDYHMPDTASKSHTDMSGVIASLSAGGKFDLSSEDLNSYLRISGFATAYNRFKTFTIDGRAEIGLEFPGAGSNMNLFLGVESLNDDGSRPKPVNSTYVYLGFRFLGNNIAL